MSLVSLKVKGFIELCFALVNMTWPQMMRLLLYDWPIPYNEACKAETQSDWEDIQTRGRREGLGLGQIICDTIYTAELGCECL